MPGNTILPHARDEFGTLKSAVLWGGLSPIHTASKMNVPPPLVDVILQQYRSMIPPKIMEHMDFRRYLETKNIHIVYPEHPTLGLANSDTLNAVGEDPYCRDHVGVVDDIIYHTRLPAEKMESDVLYRGIMDRVPSERKKHVDALFSWGNGLLYEEYILAGFPDMQTLGELLLHKESAEQLKVMQTFDAENAGLNMLNQSLNGTGRTLLRIMVNCHTDIDFVLAPLPRKKAGGARRALAQIECLSEEAVETLRQLFDEIIPIKDPERVLGANILWLNPESAVIAAEAAQTAGFLEHAGYEVKKLPMKNIWGDLNNGSQYAGGWRCTVAPLQRMNDHVG